MSDSKRQKLLFRIAKRIITCDKRNVDIFKQIGKQFVDSLRSLKNTAK